MEATSKTWWAEAIFGEVAEQGKTATITDEAAFTAEMHRAILIIGRSGQAQAAKSLLRLLQAPDPAAFQKQHPASVRRALRLLRKPVHSDRLRPLCVLVAKAEAQAEANQTEEGETQVVRQAGEGR